MNNIIKFESMPVTILGFLLNIEDSSYSVVNTKLNSETKEFIITALDYFKNDGMGVITVADLSKKSAAVKYAEDKGLKLNDNERIYKYS